MKSNKEYVILGLVIFLIILLGLLELTKKPATPPLISNPKPLSSETEVKTNEEGNVTVAVRYLPDNPDSDRTSFQIALDTHSVDLDSFDFQKNIYIKQNSQILTPLRINPSGSQHHRQAEISFKKISPPFTLVVTNLAGVDKRIFTY